MSLYRVYLKDMANIREINTGIECCIWIDLGAYQRPLEHSKYRLKVSKTSNHPSIVYCFMENKWIGNFKIVELSNDIIKKVEKWSIINYDMLLKFFDRKDDKSFTFKQF